MPVPDKRMETVLTGSYECSEAQMAATIQNSLKVALRKTMKDALKGLDAEAIARQSKAVTTKVLQSEVFRQAQRISIYLSTSSELDTTALLCEMFRLDKMVFVPTYEGSKMKMVRLRCMDEYENLPLTKWNIKQPDFKEAREDAMTNGHGIDLFIMPGVAFSRCGARLGHGMGFYDKFLRQHAEKYPHKKVTLMALALNEQIVNSEDLPMDAHDVRLQSIITEN
ncbi:5-formyltetrahydrofolate cyclo-ligase [Drosophila serrata]|uniref:5-formyltetrahydrofolate cyclo-ligase n=1 Tax=Drosophila serrata TaxID=7274 RepID=UPI000A1D1D36|nr:5-formyltetrahydrofolate cyclo-ligase [Drosophila serrata]XP_020801320.1 5-formyltetrahydrofolate cyclo-ligase [Drosophila serrata]